MGHLFSGKSWWRAAATLCSSVLLLSVTASLAFADADVTISEANATDINSWAFAPAEVTLNVGQSITFTNNGAQAHSASADTSGAFDTGLIPGGESKTIAFDTAGTFTYHCTPHPWMKGTITVAAAPAAAQAAPAAAAPVAAAPVAQALPTPTPFRFLTPTPVTARPVTTTTTAGTTPNAGGIPDGLPILLLVFGATALLAGARAVRGGRSK